MSIETVIREWDRPDAPLHPTIGTDAYWTSAVTWGHVGWLKEHFPPPATLLDFGCGDGRVLCHLLDAGYQAEGYDTCSASLDRLLAHRPDAVVHRTLPKKKYDLVIMLAVLIHYDHVDGMTVAKQAWDMVKSGGVLWAGVSYGDEVRAGELGNNIWPVGSIVLPDAEILIESRYPSEDQVFRKRGRRR